MDLKNQILAALGIDKSIKLEWQSKLEDGTIVVSTSDTLEAGADVSVLTEDGTTIPLPIGTYKTEDGVTFMVSEEGVVDSVSESETEEVVEAAEDDGKEADIESWSGLEKRIQNLEDAVSSLKEDKVGGDTEMADEETTEEVVEEVVEVVEAAVEEIAEAIDEATPDAVTPELAQQAAEIAVEVLQEKAEEVVDEATELENKKAKSKAKLAKLQKENKRLKEALAESPADAPINTNKFSADRPTLSKKEYNRLSKQEKFLHGLYK
jgi:chromosome segregation ATPase